MSKKNTTVGKPKTACPVGRKEFEEKAKPVAIRIGDQTLVADSRTFSSGSLGWYANGKIVIEVDGVPCKVQVGISLTLVGSKEAK